VHIGLIGGIGPAATAYYYRRLVDAHARANRRLDLTIVHADPGELLQNLRVDARTAQAAIFVGLTRRLQSAGADVVAVTSIAGHFCISEFEVGSPLPVANALEVVRSSLRARGVNEVGLLGTMAAMRSELFGGLEGLSTRFPEGDDFERTDRE
jgi:aspartate racemase